MEEGSETTGLYVADHTVRASCRYANISSVADTPKPGAADLVARITGSHGEAGVVAQHPPAISRSSSSALSSLRFGEFRLVILGTLLAFLGNAMKHLAVGWLVVQLATREGTPERAGLYLGLVAFANAASAVIFGLAGGVVADRVDRRTVLLGTRAAAAVAAMTLATIVVNDQANVPLVLALMSIAAAIHAIDQPARHAIIPSTVDTTSVVSALNVSRLVTTGCLFLGPTIGGFVIVPFGVGGVLIAVTLMYVASLVALLGLPPRTRPAVHGHNRHSAWRSMREGLAYVRGNAVIRFLVLATVTFMGLGQSYGQLLPAFADQALHAGPRELSWLLAAGGVGSLAGTAIVTYAGGAARVGRLMFAALFSIGALLIVLSTQQHVLTALPIVALLGCANLVWLSIGLNVVQLCAPEQFRGRVMSVYVMLFPIGSGIGSIVAGTLTTFIGTPAVLACAGLATAITAAVTYTRSATFRELAS